jgi:hypothetical protein
MEEKRKILSRLGHKEENFCSNMMSLARPHEQEEKYCGM